MIQALNPVTTGLHGPLEAFLDAASGAGFSAIEYAITPFSDAEGDRLPQTAREGLASRGLQLCSFYLPVEFRLDEAAFQRDLQLLERRVAAAKSLGTSRCCTWLYPATDEPIAVFTSRVVRRLRACAEILRAYDIRFGLEWLGPKTLRTMRHEWICTLPEALELIGAVDQPNVGVLLDSFHWYTSSGTIEDILSLSPEQIVMVHLNDAPDVPIDRQMDDQRLLPGEGVIDLAGMLNALRKIGYAGPVSVETFSPTLPLLGEAEAARRSKQALERTLNAANRSL